MIPGGNGLLINPAGFQAFIKLFLPQLYPLQLYIRQKYFKNIDSKIILPTDFHKNKSDILL